MQHWRQTAIKFYFYGRWLSGRGRRSSRLWAGREVNDAAENGDLDVIKALIGGGHTAPTLKRNCCVKNADSNDVLDDSDSADSEEEDDDEFTIETAEVDINARDRWRLTPIYAAALGAQLPALKLLISKGARLDIRVEKSSLLHFVCAMGGFEEHV